MSRILLSISIIMVLFFPVQVLSQEKPDYQIVEREGKTFLQHQVSRGETLYGIGSKYGVEVITILNNNPQLIGGLKAGDLLLIPWSESVPVDSNVQNVKAPQSFVEHQVKRRETLYSISRQYGVTIDEILHYNKGVGQLKKGDLLRIPQWAGKEVQSIEKSALTINDKSDSNGIYVVRPGETWYSISRRLGTTVELLNQLNPDIDFLKPGQSLNVPSGVEVPEVEIGKQSESSYKFHTIVSGETLYSLTRKYNISAESLIEINPGLAGSFRTGTVVKIPYQTESHGNSERYLIHVVKPGETQYSLQRAYNVSQEDLKKWNNYLDYRNILVGDTLRLIPGDMEVVRDTGAHANANELVPGDCDKIRKGWLTNEPVDIVMFLPLMIDVNSRINPGLISGTGESSEYQDELSKDSIRIMQEAVRNSARFQGTSENFIHFYEGSLLAIKNLQKQGVKVRLTVIDTEKRSQQLSSLISSGRFNDADLIIGPIFTENQKVVADFSMKMQIPMVSPLSSSDEQLKNNSWTFQVNPPRRMVDQLTAEYIFKEYSRDNIVFLKNGSQSDYVESELRRLFSSGGSGNVEGRFPLKSIDMKRSGIGGLTEALQPDGRNVVVLTSGNEAEVSVAVSNLHTIAGKYNITLVGSNRFTQFESINQEYYHDGQLEFLAPYWPDYTNSKTREFVSNFREYFKTEPNQYSMQGYDVTYFFTKAISQYGNDFKKCMNLNREDLVQGNYFFVPQPGGEFVNEGLNVISYTRDYRVVKKKDLKKF